MGRLGYLQIPPNSSLPQFTVGVISFGPGSQVRVKKEIVTMGVEDVDPAQGAVHVDPKDWNALLRDPEAFIIDVRNSYEYRIGTFEGSIDPKTKNFPPEPILSLVCNILVFSGSQWI